MFNYHMTNHTAAASAVKPESGEMRLAQAYVPPQAFRMLYSPDQVLLKGTIFQELDMPYTKDHYNRK